MCVCFVLFYLPPNLTHNLQGRIAHHHHSSSCQQKFNIKNLKHFCLHIRLLKIKFQLTKVSLYNGKYKIWTFHLAAKFQISQVCFSLQDFQGSSTQSHQGLRLLMGDQGNSGILETLWKVKVLDIIALSLSHYNLDERHVFYSSSFNYFFFF